MVKKVWEGCRHLARLRSTGSFHHEEATVLEGNPLTLQGSFWTFLTLRVRFLTLPNPPRQFLDVFWKRNKIFAPNHLKRRKNRFQRAVKTLGWGGLYGAPGPGPRDV